MPLPSLSKLTPEQVNRMCAEAMGWRWMKRRSSYESDIWLFRPDSQPITNGRTKGMEGVVGEFDPCDRPDWPDKRLNYVFASKAPVFAADPAAALSLCESLPGHLLELIQSFAGWTATIVEVNGKRSRTSASADTPALAIARAYLKAKNLATE